jgi:hypothetical protein
MTTEKIITEKMQLQRLNYVLALIEKSRKKEKSIMNSEYYHIFGTRNDMTFELNRQYNVTVRLTKRYNEEKIKYTKHLLSAE